MEMTDLLEANLPLGTLILPKEKNDKKKKQPRRECPETAIDDSILSVGYICSSYFWSS